MLSLLLSSFLLCLAFISLPIPARAVPPTIRFGGLFPQFDLSGRISIAGQQEQAAFEMAVRELNDKADGLEAQIATLQSKLAAVEAERDSLAAQLADKASEPSVAVESAEAQAALAALDESDVDIDAFLK